MKSPQVLAAKLAQQWHSADWRERQLLGGGTAWPLTLSIGQPDPAVFLNDATALRNHLQQWRASMRTNPPPRRPTRSPRLRRHLESAPEGRAATSQRVARCPPEPRPISRDGRVYTLAPTQGGNQLHGGPDGFDKRRWRIVEQSAEHVLLAIDSPDGDQGFPGNLEATVCYRLQDGARVAMEYSAKVDAPCPVNLTNHAYFNLDGAPTDVRGHTLQIRAQHYLPIDDGLIPLGALAEVAGSSFDFMQPKTIARDFLADAQQRIAAGYDHAYLLDDDCRDCAEVASTLVSGDGALAMDLYTSKPALQFYSGNHLAGIPAREGVYAANQGLALETQFLPDSPNHPEWPQTDCWLQPGQTYRQTTVLAFRAL